jgi:DNA polymerase-3 subunit gamma/tau
MAVLSQRLKFVAESEGVEVEPAAISAIARMADGGFRDALTLLEQVIIATNGRITTQSVYDQLGLVSEEHVDTLLRAIAAPDPTSILKTVDECMKAGKDPRSLVESVLHRLGDLTRVSYQVQTDSHDSARDASMHELATGLGKDKIVWIRSELSTIHAKIRDITLPRLWLEGELLRVASCTGRAEAKPHAAKPVAKPNPDPKAVKTPTEAVITPKTESDPAPEPPKSTAATNDWEKLLNALPLNPATKTPSVHALKLESSTLISDDGNTLLVSIPQQMTHNWFEEQPKRMAFLLDNLKLIGREGTQIKFRVEKTEGTKINNPETVELPLEGEELAQLVKKTFNINEEVTY